METVKLDRQSLYQFYGDAVDDLREIFNDYLKNRNTMLASLQKAYESGTEALAASVHYHSSVFSYIGLPMLTTDCHQFETLCKRSAVTSEVKNEFEELVSRIYKSISIVQQEVERLNMLYIS